MSLKLGKETINKIMKARAERQDCEGPTTSQLDWYKADLEARRKSIKQ